MATIRERQNGNGRKRYHVQIRKRGHPSQTATFDRLTDAKRWITDVESDIQRGRFLQHYEARKHTVAEMIDRWRNECLPDKPRSRRTFEGQLSWWETQLGDYLLSDLTPERITQSRDKLRRLGASGRPVTPSTVNRYLACLSIVLSAAVKDWHWISDNPSRQVRKLVEARGRTRFLSETERVRLLKVCQKSPNRMLYPAVLLSITTGVRQSECLNLTWDRLDLKQGRVTIIESKNGEPRSIPLAKQTLTVLRNYARIRRLDTHLVFPSDRDPLKPTALRHAWLLVLKAAKIEDFRWHDLRHSAASYLAMSGATLTEIADILGHKTLQMVQRYSHLSEQHTTHVVNRMADKFFGVGKS